MFSQALFDEASTFLTSLGRYNNGNGAYEKSVLNTIWGCPPFYIRDVSGRRSRMIRPLLNLSMCAHAMQIVSLLTAERFSYDDGFYHRILFMAPQASKYMSEDLLNVPERGVTVHAILLFVRLLHEVERHYTFDAEARSLYCKFYDELQEFIWLANTEFEVFLS